MIKHFGYQQSESAQKKRRTDESIQKKRQTDDCTIGAALIYSQSVPTNTLNITEDAVLYVPTANVIYGQVHAINIDGRMPFEYLSLNDPSWNSIVTNVGEGIYLLARTTCPDVLVSGTFNYEIAFNAD